MGAVAFGNLIFLPTFPALSVLDLWLGDIRWSLPSRGPGEFHLPLVDAVPGRDAGGVLSVRFPGK